MSGWEHCTCHHCCTCSNDSTRCPQIFTVRTPCEGWTPCDKGGSASYGKYSEESLAIKGGTQSHCVATLFGGLCTLVGGSRDPPLRQFSYGTSTWSFHERSRAFKGGTQPCCVATLFGRLRVLIRSSRIKGCTQLHCGTTLIGGWHTGSGNPHCSTAAALLTDINHIDERTVDDLMGMNHA